MINLQSQSIDWVQPNSSDLLGNIYVTKNITFDTEGYIRLSYSPRAAMTPDVDSDFNNPSVIIISEDHGYFCQTWEEPFAIDTRILFAYPTQITDANIPAGTSMAGAVWFGGLLPVSEATDLSYYNPSSNAWTDTNISLSNTSQAQHPIESFLSASALAVSNVNTIQLYESPLTATPTALLTNPLTILADFFITGICYFNQNLYIATMNRYGGQAYVYVWNGQGSAAQGAYKVDSNIIFDICVHRDAIWCVTGNGELLKFNGGSFEHKAAFPLFYFNQALTDEININMYHNMLKSAGDTLYINFNNNSNDSRRLLNMPDGIWCYDEKVGLYHRYSRSNSLVIPETIATASVNTTTNQITVSSAPVTGTEVFYNNSGSTSLSPLTNNAKYFVIKIDSTHIKLAETKTLAIAGTGIDLTGTGNSFQKLVYFPNIDFGASLTDRSMALNVIQNPTTTPQYGFDVIWGGEVYNRTDGSTNWQTLGTVSTNAESRGYFITPKIFSTGVTDNFNKLTLKFTKLTSDLDKIIIKYRTTDDMRQFIDLSQPTAWQATWTSTTTFTTTETEMENSQVGDEIEFLRGAGGGILAHITAISENAGTYTVTIDETYDNYQSGDKARFVFRNWTKLIEIAYGDSNAEQCFYSEDIGQSGKWIQFKIELRGIETRIEQLLLDNVFRLPAKDK